MPKVGLEPTRPLGTLDFESDGKVSEVTTGLELGPPGCEACTSACTDCWVSQENELARVIGAWKYLPLFVRTAVLTLLDGLEQREMV